MTKPLRKATAYERMRIAAAMVSAVLDLGTAIVDEGHRRYELPADVEPRTWGSVILGLNAEGIIVGIGRDHTRRDCAHGRSVVRYFAPDISRAEQYLARLNHASGSKRRRQLTLPGLNDTVGGEK